MTQARLTVSGFVHYNGPRHRAMQAILRYDRALNNADIQPYQRGPIPSPTKWQPIDLGWIKKPGIVVIQYSRSAEEPLLLTISNGANCDLPPIEPALLCVLPGEALPFHPTDISDWLIKGDGSSMVITAYPE